MSRSLNNFVTTEKEKNGTRYIFLDTKQTKFRHLKWHDLGGFGKRKVENYLVMSNMNDKRKYIKVVYI